MNENELEKEYYRIKDILERNGFYVSESKTISFGLQFKINGELVNGVLRIYKNKKYGIKIDYSLLKNNASIIFQLVEGNVTDKIIHQAAESKKINQSNINYEFGLPIIGSDESGKGDYFGPLVSAAVYIDEKSSEMLKDIGVKDSKKLDDTKALELSDKICDICSGKYSVIEISPSKYNLLYNQFKKEGQNLNSLLAWGHAKAIEELLQSVKCDKAIADKFADDKFILGKLQEKGKSIQLIQIPKAEENIAVAAASILARARFLRKLNKLSYEFGVRLPKGVSPIVVDTAKSIVMNSGKDSLSEVAKLHFKTTKLVLGVSYD